MKRLNGKAYYLFANAAAVIVALIAISSGYAYASGIGASQIQINPSTASVHAGSSTSVGYTVRLTSGTTWGTTISAADASQLSSDGISISFSNSYADPTYSGTMTITTSSSTKAGTYNVTLEATGDDPSTSTTTLSLVVLAPSSSPSTTTTTVPAVGVPAFNLINKSTRQINASVGGNVSIGSLLSARIRPGTYVLINGSRVSSYNFSLVLFSSSNVTSPPNESSYVPGGAYAFEVNNQITPSIEFVNSSGKPYAVISTVAANYSTTTWTFLGGAFNGTAYKGGKYAFADVWNHVNSTTMVNTQFVKPVMWVFETNTSVPASPTKPITTTTTPSAPTTPAQPSNTLYYVAIAIVIIIIAMIAALLLRKK
ncbi:MAG: hypothetical protein ACP5MZ_00445 [Candidatus Micrarchaeia archaeon]